MSTSWISDIRTPEIIAWNHKVIGKNQRRIARPITPTPIQIINIVSIISIN
jgi:hypothetical protein